ncbi:MAG: hypothetical protein WAN03_04425 [Candidatus Sulfotelmatobacter sp.]
MTVLSLYRFLLRLYPAMHRLEYGDEMIAIFGEVRDEIRTKKWICRLQFYGRETAGLMAGIIQERLQGFPGRRFEMRNGFRFPKTTAILMAVILGGVMLAIQKGEAIEVSLAEVNPPIGPIQAAPHSTLLSGIVVLWIFFCALGLAGWGVLFALRRSGVHRLADAAETK